MKKHLFYSTVSFALLLFLFAGCANEKDSELKIIATSDVHGNFFPYDFINDRPAKGSLSRVSTYLKEQRKALGDRVIYVDNGDILQGQPTSYYYNTVAVDKPHLAAEVLNYMGCEVGTLGNHDIEPGGPTYQRYIRDAHFPILGANILFEDMDKTFVPPYTIVTRNKTKIAFIGMLTPAIPNWLPKELWRELRFDEMVGTAKKWVQYVKENEQPDVIIGIFHSGLEGGIVTPQYAENASLQVAREVPGFDAVIFGHDHRAYCDSIRNTEGDNVVLVNPANGANYVAELTLRKKAIGHSSFSLRLGFLKYTWHKKNKEYWAVEGKLVPMADVEPDEDFLKTFEEQFQTVKDYVSKRIGTITRSISTKDAYFGPSAFMDFVHQMQLEISNAEVSLAAPLSYVATIDSGDVYVRDMFNLYKFENTLYLMNLSGHEILGHLEMSYDMWTNQMKSPEDHLLLFNDDDNDVGSVDKNGGDNKSKRPRFKNIYYNFDSAAGIIYEVDVTKPEGQRVKILRMADGRPFELDHIYRVAVNSYRGNGGGELLTRGAGIPQEELSSRILHSTSADLRYYMLSRIEMKDTITPVCLNEWKFVPEKWTVPAGKRDYQLLFGE